MANAVGVRTRLVENQIHSFCEVQQPNGTWRRIEFRLGDEPGPSATLVRTTNAVSEAPLAYALTPLLGCGVLALLLFGWRRDVFSHAVQSQERQSRNLQRSTQGLMEANGAVRVLLKHVCDRLVHRDLLALTSSAVTEADSSAPPRIRARIRSVLALCKRSQNDVFDIGEMQRAYWDSYYVLRWINREEKRDNHH